MTKKIIGRVDSVDFPELNLFNTPAKIDTGAYTSAIHCSSILENNGKLHCVFFNENLLASNTKPVIFDSFSRTDVKSSNGFKENRYKIKTEVIVFGKCYKINLTLSTRDDMRFPVLIGRQFLRKKFIVDVDLEDVSISQKYNEHSYTL